VINLIKNTKIIFIISFLLIGLVSGASALEYTNTFDSCSFGTGWATSGTPNFQFSSLGLTAGGTGTCYAWIQSATGAQFSYANYSFSNATLLSFDLYADGAATTGAQAGAMILANTTHRQYIVINDVNVRMFNDTYFVSGVYDTAYSPVAVSKGNWYHFSINVSNNGGTYSIVITNSTTGTQISAQDVTSTRIITNSSRFQLYHQGKVSGSDGRWDNVYLSTGVPLSTYITWSKSEYIMGEDPYFGWNINDTDWNAYECALGLSKCFFFADVYHTDIYNPTELVSYIIRGDSNTGFFTYIDINDQNDLFLFSFRNENDTSTYVTNLRRGLFYATSEIMTNSTTFVRGQGTSYINVPSFAPIKTNINITYNIGIGGITTAIILYYINNGVEEQEMTYYPTTSNGTIEAQFARVGTYKVKFQRLTTSSVFPNLPKYLDTEKTVTTTYVVPQIVNNFSTSSIHVNGTNYFMMGVLSGNYTVDWRNFTQGTIYVDVYNTNTSAITAQFFTGTSGEFTKEFGTFNIYISDINNNGISSFLSGSNILRLKLDNRTSGNQEVLATNNFTINDLNPAGYGMTFNPSNRKVLVNNPVYVTVTSPADGAYVEITNPVTGFSKLRYNLTTGTRTLQNTFGKAGLYAYALYNPTNGLENAGGVTVSKEVITTTPTPTVSAPVALASWTSNMWNFMSTNSFWGLIILILVIYAIPNMFFAFAIINIECSIGLFSPFTWYILAATWLGAGLIFITSGTPGKVVTGDK